MGSNGKIERRPTLVTGGAGFVGSNLVDRLAREGRRVRILDDLSRPGVEHNLEWLLDRHPDRVEVIEADLRDSSAVRRAVAGTEQVYHFAAQVAVTTSLADPIADFEVNLRGTLDVLEAIRAQRRPPGLILTSTNKVYGALDDVEVVAEGSRYEPVDHRLRRRGVDESRALDFHSPYGCSKGGADQYVLDYSRCMGLRTAVFRMSCIYGPRQFGNEDQGWVAHFLLRALQGEPITLFGDGRQVRDLLFVDDLVEAFLAVEARLSDLPARVFNVGGGPASSASLLEVLDLITEIRGERPRVEWSSWRPGDQRWYVSDPRRLEELCGWRPRVGVRQGLARLHEWLRAFRPDRQLAALDSVAMAAPRAEHLPLAAGEAIR